MTVLKAMSTAAGLQSVLQRAIAAYERNDFVACAKFSYQVLAIDKHHSRALELLAHAHVKTGQGQLALEFFQRCLALEPGNAKVARNAAKLNIGLQHYEKALLALDAVTKAGSDDADSHYLRALCQGHLQHWPQAIAEYARVIELDPHRIAAYLKLVAILSHIGCSGDALSLLDGALTVNPLSTELLFAKARLLVQRGQYSAALSFFAAMEALGTEVIDHWIEHAQVLAAMKRGPEAQSRYLKALELAPDHYRAMSCYAKWLVQDQRDEEALAVYARMNKAKPADTMVWVNMGNLHGARRQLAKANECYRQAFWSDPKAPRVAGSYLYSMSFLCDWRDFGPVMQSLQDDASHERVKAFQSVVFQNDAATNLAYARSTVARDFKATGVLGRLGPYSVKERIRVGYYSADFYNHATVMLIEGLLASHDRNRFELHAFSLNGRRRDAYTDRVMGLFDHFHDVSGLSDRAVTYLSRQQEIDIAIDLKGFTENSRTQIFAERSAPAQINYLGFPGTMGADFMDYMVADHYTITSANRTYFSEKIIFMPDCYQPNNPARPSPGTRLTTERPPELPAGAFVFCSFNNTYKLNPSTLDVWLGILRQACGSVLWLLRTTGDAELNIRKYVGNTDIDPNRIIFAKHLPEAQHLARLAHADVFLDTFPCNAHTTASDALWAGVPIITRSGETFASRVAGSILSTVGLAELITDSEAAYQALAMRLYGDPSYRDRVGRRVRQGVRHGALYDAKKYTRHFEQALLEVYRRTQQGLEPCDIEVTHTCAGATPAFACA
jgi:predicted O-linked N-acetylglucosamine transferase (SPINDLY family)